MRGGGVNLPYADVPSVDGEVVISVGAGYVKGASLVVVVLAVVDGTSLFILFPE